MCTCVCVCYWYSVIVASQLLLIPILCEFKIVKICKNLLNFIKFLRTFKKNLPSLTDPLSEDLHIQYWIRPGPPVTRPNKVVFWVLTLFIYRTHESSNEITFDLERNFQTADALRVAFDFVFVRQHEGTTVLRLRENYLTSDQSCLRYFFACVSCTTMYLVFFVSLFSFSVSSLYIDIASLSMSVSWTFSC